MLIKKDTAIRYCAEMIAYWDIKTRFWSQEDRDDAMTDIFVRCCTFLREEALCKPDQINDIWSKSVDYWLSNKEDSMCIKDNGAEAVMEVLRDYGITQIKVLQVVDRESGVIGWYGIEDATGRVFDLVAYDVPEALQKSAEALAKQLYAAFRDWVDQGRPKWYERRNGNAYS